MPRKLNIDMVAIVSHIKANAESTDAESMAEHLNLTVSFLKKIADSQGIKVMSKQAFRNRYRVNAIREAVMAGRSLYTIAKEMDEHYNTIYNLASRYLKVEIQCRKRVYPEKEMHKNGIFNVNAVENWLV